MCGHKMASAWQVNPPPNWPLPGDWSPPAGWQPNPAWGVPARDWPLWIDEEGNPAWPAQPAWQTTPLQTGPWATGSSTGTIAPAVAVYGQPPAVPGGYGYPGYPQLYGPGPSQATNGFSIAALVLGILWVYWLGSILALIFGYVALSQIKKRGGSGRGMAIAGVVLGWVGIALSIVVLIIVVAIDHSLRTDFRSTTH